MTPTITLLALLLASPFPAPAPTLDDPCASSGHCHLPRFAAPLAATSGLYGRAVATDGATRLVVGEPGADRVHVYTKTGLAWQHDQTLVGPADSQFGRSVALSGTRLLVGAPLDDAAANDAGAAYLFELAGSTFQPETSFFSNTPASGDAFGDAVGLSGNRVAVGAPQAAAGGRVEAFVRTGDLWSYVDTFTSGSGSLGDALAVAGDTLAIGDWTDSAMGPSSGVVHFMRILAGGLTPSVELRPQDLASGDQFGWSLALAGDRLIVGAPGDDELANNAGAAYVFERVTTFVSPFVDFEEVDELRGCRAAPSDGLGWSVAIDGEHAAVGAKAAGVAGSVFTFERTQLFGESWAIEDEIRPADGVSGDWFGCSVALAPNAVFVGAQFADEPWSNTGALYVVSTASDLLVQGECPCDALAAHAFYGAGKPGLAGVPVLELVGEIVPGESVFVRASNLTQGTLPVLLWGLQPAVLPFDDGFLGMADPNLIALPVVGPLGQVGKNLAVPPGICGLVVALQVMVLDPGASGPVGSAQSEAIYAVIGY